MKLGTYILTVVLMTLIGVCTIHEVMRQTHAQYEIGTVLSQEENLRHQLAVLKTDLAMLRSGQQLNAMRQELDTELAPLEPVVEVELADPIAFELP